MPKSLKFQTLTGNLRHALKQTLRQPVAVSAIASFGAHIVIFAVLPILPTASRELEELDTQRTVPLVELTPAEQSRLPDFSARLFDLPPTPPGIPDFFSTLPPLPEPPPLPDATMGLPPLSLPSTPSFFFPPLPPPSALRQSPPVTRPPVARVNPAPTPTPTPTPTPSPQGDLFPSDDEPLEPTGETVQMPDLAGIPSGSETSQSEPPPSPAPRSPDRITQALIAEQREMRELYTYNAEGTSTDSALQEYTAWFEQAVSWMAEDWDGENARTVELSGDYPRAACVGQLSGTAIVGIMVDADGNPVEEPAPRIIQSSGYRIFNQRALEAAQSYEFEATGQRSAYQVAVRFEYNEEICPPSLRRSAEQTS